MTAPTMPQTFDGTITAPGVYDISAEAYHADPVPGGSLSSSGARKLLPPSCPALYQYERLHGQPHKDAYDFGHIAHKEALGSGPELVVVEADDWRTSKARQARVDAREAGMVALLQRDYEVVLDMADALRADPAARALFGGRGGRPEQSLFWVDGPSGIWRRARFDWFPVKTATRLLIPDYKTTKSAAPDNVSKAVNEYGYQCQAAWYLDAAKALGLAGNTEPVFLFVFQEKSAPYLVTVAELTLLTVEIGHRLNRQAIDTYKECATSGRWPGYSDRIVQISLPGYAENKYMQEMFQ